MATETPESEYVLRGLNLKMPEKLKRAIVQDAFDRSSNQNTVVVEILAEHYDIEVETTSRRTVPFGGGRPRGDGD